MRPFVLFSLIACLVPLLAVGAQPRPNIVVLLADDMRWDAMSCAGNAFFKTPHIDRLAAEGLRFTDAFVTTSICCTSRASFLTGQYARRHGVNDFETRAESLAAMYPMLLHSAGYHTGFIGKWGIAAGNREYFRRCAEAFDFWAGDMGQTSYWHDRDCNYLANNGTTDRTKFFCDCPQAARIAQGCGPDGPHPSLKDPVHAETEFIPDKIRAFLDSCAKDRPFCLSVSFKAPHEPWQGVAPRFRDAFANAQLPRRGNISADEAGRQPGFLRRSLKNDVGLRLVTDDAERNRLFRQYAGLVAGIDFAIGELLRELAERGLAANTVILFSSDNGHFAGEHGFFGKWFMHEESIRVPLLISDPRLPEEYRGQVSREMALNIDLAPTVLELAGLAVPAGMQGSSLLPLLRNPQRPLRDSFFYEHLYTPPAKRRHIEQSEGVRTRDRKYIVWTARSGPQREELYRLSDDPLEMKNLAADPVAASMLAEMRRLHASLRESLK